MDDKIKKQMLKDFNLNKSDLVESPRKKAHTEMIKDPNKLGHFITYTMNRLIQAGKGISWDEYCSSAEWAVIAMNLTEDEKFKFGNKWKEIYDELLTPDVPSAKKKETEGNAKEVKTKKKAKRSGSKRKKTAKGKSS